MVGRPSLEPGLEPRRGAYRGRHVDPIARVVARQIAGCLFAWLIAAPPAWADAGSPPPEAPNEQTSEPPADQVEAPAEPEPEQQEPEQQQAEPVAPHPEELAQEEPMPPPAMIHPPPFAPPMRFNGRQEQVESPTRMETADGVTMLSNRPDQDEQAADGEPEPKPDVREPSTEEPPADMPTMGVLPNQAPLGGKATKRRKDRDDDVEGLGWIWLLVGAAGLLLVPIGLLLNRGARRQTSIPPSRS